CCCAAGPRGEPSGPARREAQVPLSARSSRPRAAVVENPPPRGASLPSPVGEDFGAGRLRIPAPCPRGQAGASAATAQPGEGARGLTLCRATTATRKREGQDGA